MYPFLSGYVLKKILKVHLNNSGFGGLFFQQISSQCLLLKKQTILKYKSLNTAFEGLQFITFPLLQIVRLTSFKCSNSS